MKLKPTDLRLKSPLERAKMIHSVQREMDTLGSQSEVARRLKINRRTVAKYLIEPEPDIIHSPLTQLVNLIFKRYARRGHLDDVRKELGYRWNSSTEPKYGIARAQTEFGRNPDILLSLVVSSLANDNLTTEIWNSFPGPRYEGSSIQRLIANERPVKIILKGVLLSQDSFLADNLEFFRELALAHPEKKPMQLRKEAFFCLGYLFGFRASEWIQSVNQQNFRWHIHKVKSQSVR